MNQHNKPCAGCPWGRREPTLGGSPVETYVGQIALGFWLPCHCSANYRAKASDVNEVAQCAGAAIFRSNIGVADRMPSGLLSLPRDTARVFATLADFYAHHTGRSRIELAKMLTPEYVAAMMDKEWNDAQVRAQIYRRRA